MFEKINDEVQTWVHKIIIPALVAVSIKLAIQAGQKKLTIFQVVASFITGVGSAYLCGSYVMAHISNDWLPIVISVIAISGEKIGYYVIYKLNVEGLLDILIKIFKK